MTLKVSFNLFYLECYGDDWCQILSPEYFEDLTHIDTTKPLMSIILGRGDKLENFDLPFFPLLKNSNNNNRPFSYCIYQAGLGAFTAKSGHKLIADNKHKLGKLGKSKFIHMTVNGGGL